MLGNDSTMTANSPVAVVRKGVGYLRECSLNPGRY